MTEEELARGLRSPPDLSMRARSWQGGAGGDGGGAGARPGEPSLIEHESAVLAGRRRQ